MSKRHPWCMATMCNAKYTTTFWELFSNAPHDWSVFAHCALQTQCTYVVHLLIWANINIFIWARNNSEILLRPGFWSIMQPNMRCSKVYFEPFYFFHVKSQVSYCLSEGDTLSQRTCVIFYRNQIIKKQENNRSHRTSGMLNCVSFLSLLSVSVENMRLLSSSENNTKHILIKVVFLLSPNRSVIKLCRSELITQTLSTLIRESEILMKQQRKTKPHNVVCNTDKLPVVFCLPLPL